MQKDNLIHLEYPLHHIAIAVNDIEKSSLIYIQHLNYKILDREKVEEFGAEVAFLLPANSNIQSTAIELITPISSTSNLQKFIDKRGEGLHHICFAVKDIKAEQSRLEKAGYIFTSPTAKHGAHHGLVNFIHPKGTNGTLIELRQEKQQNI